MLHKYIEKYFNKEVKARILYVNRYGIYIKDEHELTGVIPLTKSMHYRNNSVVINGREYRSQEQIDVVLKKDVGNELIYDLVHEKAKKRTKKKVVQDDKSEG